MKILHGIVGGAYIIATIYVIVGVFHSIYFHFFISRVDCLAPKGLVYIYCNTGIGIAHLVTTLGWPFYYF